MRGGLLPPRTTTCNFIILVPFDHILTSYFTATDTTPVVPEVKKESVAAPQTNTVAAAAPLPDLKDATPASPTAAPTAPAEPSKTAETDPIHSVQPVQKSEEPIMAEPVTEAAKSAHDEVKPAILAEPTKKVESAEAADIPAPPTFQGENIPRELTTKKEHEAEASRKKNEKAKKASLTKRAASMIANIAT